MRLVLWGDGESPHLLKWARRAGAAGWSCGRRPAAASCPASTRWCRPSGAWRWARDPTLGGGNVALLRKLPRFARWLRRVRPDWVHAHYLTSHGTLAWLATAVLGAPGRLVGSAWGSDVLRHAAAQRAAARADRAACCAPAR